MSTKETIQLWISHLDWETLSKELFHLDRHRRQQPREHCCSCGIWTSCHWTKMDRILTIPPILPKRQHLLTRKDQKLIHDVTYTLKKAKHFLEFAKTFGQYAYHKNETWFGTRGPIMCGNDTICVSSEMTENHEKKQVYLYLYFQQSNF